MSADEVNFRESLSPKKRSIKTCQTREIVVAIMEDKITFPEEKLVPRHFQNLIYVRHVVIFKVQKPCFFSPSLLFLVQFCQEPNFQYFWNKWVTMSLCFSSQSRIYHVCAQNILINHDSSQKTSNWAAAAPQNHHQIEHGRMLIEKGKLLVLFDDAIFYFFAWKCNKALTFMW